jgi:tRNA 2-thiocytidine biosynthesis protein TtcA
VKSNDAAEGIPKTSLERVMDGSIPPWIMRFVKQTGRTINRFSMIGGDETILLGISGGKDSLALALALSMRLKWLPISYQIHALHIDWKEYPVPTEEKERLKHFFSILNIPFKSLSTTMFPDSFKGDFNCYLCSRNRRRILFETARDMGVKKIALGHHLDDLVETTIINLFFRGSFDSMKPVQDFFSGKIQVIRPMSEVKEQVIKRLISLLDLPVVKPDCPYHGTNIRAKIKPIVKELSHIDRYAREHVFSALQKLEKRQSSGPE